MEQEINVIRNKNKLSPGFKRKWVKALRSGNYSQGGGVLYDSCTKTYDPVGVAHRIVGVKNKLIENKFYTTRKHKFVPHILCDKNEVTGKIASFNDKGLSFKWIASYIEKYL